ncbi:hypothetical protein [Nostoc sp. FACHB-888]|uniref:hypothetical protein n=1 Tax=Nostoc sp. FACHB-888 TaxID=2692842 RepID=UPI0016826E6E|nr:hypothetical protein [Nostoc sp. FACHB-888]MBD2245918.1 hypothetical protein [Nostoc sp. FACHB-888]MCC5649389.1 hypothetical protein [Nostoc sp. XA013]
MEAQTPTANILGLMDLANRKSVMYLDNPLKEHKLLQTMPTAGYAYARTNRVLSIFTL